MPTLVIDGLAIEVAPGTKVIDAAERLGIMIPRFCYHEALGAVGACRMCAVKFLEGPVKGIQMSCMVDAQDGMVVSTTDEEAVAFRRFVIECLMRNHPHDCPVCDEGGQCLLQDETVSGGHGLRRYLGPKRTYRDQFLGPFIAHEMNRCIHCYRCARFYQEYAGYRDLGVMQIGSRVYFGRHGDGALESPFAGNLVDLCPTGVYTDKAARYKARHWDMERAPSVCIHCSLGCSTVANARYREVLRVEARENSAVNGSFICDRGRFGFGYTSHPKRPRQARVHGRSVERDVAMATIAERLRGIAEAHGPESVAAMGSPRASMETLLALKILCRAGGWRGPIGFVDDTVGEKNRRAAVRLDSRLAVSMRDLESADLILALGVDAVQEAPMLALAMRQAQRKGVVIGVVDPRPVVLPFPFIHIPAGPWQMEAVLKAIAGRQEAGAGPAAATSADEVWGDQVNHLREELGKSQRPMLVCGTDIVPASAPDSAADVALAWHEEKGSGGIFYILSGPNAFGTAWLAPDDPTPFTSTLEAIEAGRVKALVVVEADLFRDFPEPRRLEEALQKLELLVVLDYLPTQTVWRSHCFLPACTVFEADASYVNQEGRLQQSQAVHAGGTPIWQETNRSHPLRVFRNEVPGSDPMPSWRILGELQQKMYPGTEPDEHPLQLLEAEPTLPGLAPTPLGDSARILPHDDPSKDRAGDVGLPKDSSAELTPAPDQFLLLLTDWTFGTEELSGHAPFLRKVEPAPRLTMHTLDAAELGFTEGDIVQLPTQDGPLTIPLYLADRMARSVLVLPRHMQLDWQNLGRTPKLLSLSELSIEPKPSVSTG